jgi:energy-coupling factor transport system permease protein
MHEIFQYRSGTSIFHRMNPLAKIAGVAAVVVLAVLTRDPLVLGGMVLAIAALGTFAGLGRVFLGQVPLLVFLGGFLVAVTWLTLPETGLLFGLALALRFCAMVFAFQFLVSTTMPTALVRALRRIGFPADYALMTLVALRFIPHLQNEGKKIYEAQAARGFSPGRGLRGRVRGVVPVLVPLITNALARAEVIGMTIDLRRLRERL